MRDDLMQWQWATYPANHLNRKNLVIHLVAVPLFITGTLALAMAPFTAWWLGLSGLVTMVLALAAQSRGHTAEHSSPTKFLGAGDFISRVFTEQFVTFPRFVLSGKCAAAWRGAATK